MKLLRLFTGTCALFIFSLTAKAQWVSIPDTNFAKYLATTDCSQCLQGNSTTGWQLDTICSKGTFTTSLLCNSKGIANFNGLQYITTVVTFTCNNNPITALPALPPSLQYLSCSSTAIGGGALASLPNLPSTLQELRCANQNLTSLPALPAALTYLDCSDNGITVLPALPNSLVELYVQLNALASLPALPAALQNFNCANNAPLTTLPSLPASLLILRCEFCQITALPALPSALILLRCEGNDLSSLPTLPGSLTEMYCSQNNITQLPALPVALQNLSCDNNPLTALPALPPGLTQLHCNATTITALPALPDSLTTLNISNTPLTCLPQLKKVKSFYFNQTGLTCLPNYPVGNTTSVPALNTMPLCNLFNNNGCAVYWNISGKVYSDANANCVYNTGETGINNTKVQLWQNGNLLQQTIASVGVYSFDVSSYGTYQITVDTANTVYRIKCPSTGSLTSVISAADSIDYNMDFALECKAGFDLEAKSVFGSLFRPANYTHVDVVAGDASNFYNAHCAAGVSGSVTLSFTGPAKYISPANGALTPNVTGNILTWNVADFGMVNFFADFDIILQTDTLAQTGQQVCFTLTVNPTANDNNPANNVFTQCFTVVNSYDPNDKQVYPAGNIDTTQKELTYTVRFQNTGNAEAQHIYITDTLSNHINPASFQLLAYSHQPMVQMDGNKLRFNLPNINLPDSTTNEPGSHGYVQYKITLNNNLPVGTVINNTAHIYFDFNPPVVTNTTLNTVYVPLPPEIKPTGIGKYRIQRAAMPNGKL